MFLRQHGETLINVIWITLVHLSSVSSVSFCDKRSLHYVMFMNHYQAAEFLVRRETDRQTERHMYVSTRRRFTSVIHVNVRL